MLHQSGVDFVCVDNPSANRLTVQILSAVAEAEGRAISERTQAALAAYKARGGRLGASLPQCRNLTQEGRLRGAKRAAEAHRRNAVEAYADVVGEMQALRTSGKSLREIAGILNSDGQTTRRGKPWNPVQVKRVLVRRSYDDVQV
jgi:DNA invertase Pin-like site-specific DNA recombinase